MLFSTETIFIHALRMSLFITTGQLKFNSTHMRTKTVKLFAKIKEAFYTLSEEEMVKFMLKDLENLTELECKWWMINCN